MLMIRFILFSIFLPPQPFLKGEPKMNRAEGSRKNSEEKAVSGSKKGGAPGKWPGLRGLRLRSRRKYHFLASSPPAPPSGPPATVLLSVTQLPRGKQKWSSLSLRLSDTSFSIPLAPVGVNIYRKSAGTQKAQTPRRYHHDGCQKVDPEKSLAANQILYEQTEEGELGRSFLSAWISVNKV